ncbi:hypothetical protein FOL80_06265 [Lactobacillus reuteri]|uniref:hypothetical protein n=1 Tax=Limosilactobacillus reuteri TaxID=1598 RepID=UPI00146D7467|nr:hypothetical protein [Limosilactobacillus reuteri]NMV49679.1 hypothetical protein [Limosilactobacillus reuteri]NMV51353.1 hypothetical protein [Limosilactobacillus reuteri]NMV60039.1 hypothetical protein [Limosilactobacillus reuteri]NMV61587.1 hypothetical protein [Limosilactobacillus reuteri]NMV63599.1 hypothetical protein [Limosilactobacillus reuteri]
MQPLYILQGLIGLIILFQIIATSLFNRKKKHWIAIAQMSLSVVVLALVSTELFVIGRVNFPVVLTFILQCALICIFWKTLKQFEN